MMPDCMLDLETGGTGPDAPILSIGAVGFDHRAGVLGERFYTTVDLESCVSQGARIDAGTFLWWLKQSDKARSDVYGGRQLHISVALIEFAQWLHANCAPQNAVRVWGCGSDFDNVILLQHYRRAGLEAPWEFWNNRCWRTVRSMYPNIEYQRAGVHHNALDDAVHQAEHFIHIRKTLREKTSA